MKPSEAIEKRMDEILKNRSEMRDKYPEITFEGDARLWAIIDYLDEIMTAPIVINPGDHLDVKAHQKKFGNKEVNEMLTSLKAAIGISAFVDSAIERNMAKHCVNLMKEIGPEEFGRRLKYLLSDPFMQKNCNKIKYVYNNIKGWIEPKSKSVGVIIT